MWGLTHPTHATEVGNKNYTFGVFPYLSAVRLEPIYAPVSAELSKLLDRNVQFRTASEFKRFFARLKQGRYDIALIQPFWYPPAVDQFDYQPLVRMKEPLTSVIMVLNDSPIRQVSDLEGKVIATPPAFVPVVHMSRRELARQGLDPDRDVQLKAFKTVDSCFQQVLIGAADACIAPPFAPAVIEEKMKVKLREVLRTPSIPNLSLVAHSRVPQHEREQIKQLFLSWRQDNDGKTILQRIKTAGFVSSTDKEYDAVRSFVEAINASGSAGKQQ